jgi:alpha-galactosidase
MKTRSICLVFVVGLLGWAPATFAATARNADPATDLTSKILTPPAPHTPRINGPSVYGERPGSPFLYTIPATGDRPMIFTAEGLPPGLKLDRNTGQITGSVAVAGNYNVIFSAENALGRASRNFKIAIGAQIALTPPMGWNSWNSWAGQVNQDKVLQSARMLVSSGLADHGWTYVNIDDTWQGERTGPNHALLANDKFPDLNGLCHDIHQMGLKAGIYSTPWMTSYASFPGGSSDDPTGAWDKAVQGNGNYHKVGMYHFVTADANQLAAWGFDYLKYDWDIDKANAKEMSDALCASGRDIVFSLSNSAPFNDPRRGGADDWASLANAWRTTGDIGDLWGRAPDYHHGIAEIGFAQDQWAPYNGPGHWNDEDMLVVGYVSVGAAIHPSRLTPDEQYTHISLWCLLSAPLLIGCEMDKMDAFTLNLLTNDEVLAVDQDSLGRQAVRVSGPELQLPPPAAARGRGPAQPPSGQLSFSEQVAISDALRKALSDADPEVKGILAAHPNYTLLTDTTMRNNPGGNGLVYAKLLEDGSLAVGLFNVGLRAEAVTAAWSDLGLTGKHLVRDLWRQQDLGVYNTEFSATVPAHGVVLVKIKPAP